MRKLLALCVFLCAATLFVNGCSRIPQTNSSAPTSSNPASAPTSSNPASAGNATDPEYWAQNGIAYPTSQLQVGSVYTDKEVGFQLEQPQAGEQIAIMHTSMGDIYIRFFPEAAPKAVENFLTHARNGYYDGLTFHRVIEDFMIQGGDPTGSGTGGQSIWGEDFEDEFDSKLLNLRGSLSMSNNGLNTNGSQFFINQGDADAFAGRAELESNYKINMQQLFAQFDTLLSQIRAQYEAYPLYQQYFPTLNDFFWIQLINYIVPNTDIVSEEIWALYEQYGGNIALDGATRFRGGHTVFGQVFRGMDVVDAIAGVEVDSNDKPLTDVIIHSIDVVTDWQ